MDIVARVWRRHCLKVQAFTTNPNQIAPQFKVLDNALHGLAAGLGTGEDPMQGEMFRNYSIAIDAFREILYFLRKAGRDPDEAKIHNLASMSKKPFAPDEVISHNGAHVFVRALGESYVLKQMFDSVRAGTGAQPSL